jgi:hypothetical protein
MQFEAGPSKVSKTLSEKQTKNEKDWGTAVVKCFQHEGGPEFKPQHQKEGLRKQTVQGHFQHSWMQDIEL